MTFEFRPLDAPAARAILAWRYEPPYDVSDSDAGAPSAGEAGAQDAEKTVQALLDRVNRYHAALDAGELVGFCCFGPDARGAGPGEYGVCETVSEESRPLRAP